MTNILDRASKLLDTVEPDWWDEQGAGPFYSRETVERLLAKRTVWAVYHSEDYVGSFVQGLFSSEERAQSWIDNQSNWPKDECFIAVMEIDDELRRMAEGDKHE